MSQPTQNLSRSIRSILKRFLPQIEIAVCVALGALLFWKGIRPAWRVLNTDFPNYYLVARLLREGYSLDRIYDWVWLQRIKDHWGVDQSLVGFAGLTPFSALPVYPLAAFSALTAKRIWIVFNLALLAVCVEAMQRVTVTGRRRLWVLCLLAIVPLRTSILYGQMHILVLYCMVLAWFFHKRGRDSVSGIWIALAGSLKIYPLLFWVYFVWKRQWKALAASVIGFAVLAVATDLWMGRALFHTYVTQILPASLRGEVLDPYHWANASGSALLHRLFLYEPALNPSPWINSPKLYAIFYPLWQAIIFVPLLALIRPASGDREQLEWAAFLLSLLVLSPVPSSYHFVVMILPVWLFVDFLLRRNERRLTAIVVCLYAAISVVDLTPLPIRHASLVLFGFARLWLGLLIYGAFLFSLWKTRVRGEGKEGSRRLAYVVLVAACAVVISVKAYRFHLLGREEQMGQSLPSPPEAYMETAPQTVSTGTLAVAMTSKGYRVLDQLGHEADPEEDASTNHDQLSFAAGDGSLAIEVADSSGSRILRASDREVLAENAESPAFSANGQFLAFVRERKGKGSLWVTRLDNLASGKLQIDAPIRLTSEDYDVRNGAFVFSGELAFAATHNGRSSVFVLGEGGNISQLTASSEEVGSFALSPDESNLAITVLKQGAWHLAVEDVASRKVNVITTGDCNAYRPAWSTNSRIVYATDCGRGLGLTGLAAIDITRTAPGSQ